MVFKIDKKKHKKLSEILSNMLSILKNDERVEAIIMNSYLIHVSPMDLVFEPNLFDGINIRLTIVSGDDLSDIEDILNALKDTCLKELNYNIEFSTIRSATIKSGGPNVKVLLNDGDILYDASGDATLAKILTYMEESYNKITYEPTLHIRG